MIIMSKLMYYADVTGTNDYWNKVKQELKATVLQKEAPRFFSGPFLVETFIGQNFITFGL